jgi:molecular chaperone Hsp33
VFRTKIEDPVLIEHLASLPDDSREVFLLDDGAVRVTALQGTHMINQMRANHHLGILETVVLGQAYIAGGLLASTLKGNDRLQLTIECGGPIGGVYVEAWACGAVRGYLKNVPIPIDKPLESFDLSMFYGPGFLTITKLLEGSRQPFTGQVMLQYGNLAQDLAVYYQQSEQTPSLFSLSVQFDKAGRVAGAGGMFIQAMPGCQDDVLNRLQRLAPNLPSIGKTLAEGHSVKEYIIEQFASEKPRPLAHLGVGFSCPCDRKHFEGYLSGLPENEQEEILTDGPFPLELECFNCGTVYRFEKPELERVFAKDPHRVEETQGERR